MAERPQWPPRRRSSHGLNLGRDTRNLASVLGLGTPLFAAHQSALERLKASPDCPVALEELRQIDQDLTAEILRNESPFETPRSMALHQPWPAPAAETQQPEPEPEPEREPQPEPEPDPRNPSSELTPQDILLSRFPGSWQVMTFTRKPAEGLFDRPFLSYVTHLPVGNLVWRAERRFNEWAEFHASIASFAATNMPGVLEARGIVLPQPRGGLFVAEDRLSDEIAFERVNALDHMVSQLGHLVSSRGALECGLDEGAVGELRAVIFNFVEPGHEVVDAHDVSERSAAFFSQATEEASTVDHNERLQMSVM